MKKIHFSNVNFSSSSGPNTFANRLAHSLSSRGYKIVNQNDEYDIFLCFIEPSSMPRRRSKFIHRLDGVWFKPSEFIEKNRSIRWSYDNADHVVWQSEFDKKMTLNHWGEPKIGSVIHNGISLNKIKELHPELTKIKNSSNRIFTCSASWHRQKRLKENIEFFNKNKEENDTLLVLGKNPDHLVDQSDIVYLGQQSQEICLQIYSISDWFLHLAWLDHCPNVVVEALSQNCSVVCTDSGGTKEVVKENGIIIPEKTKYNFELADYDSPYELEVPKLNLTSKNVKNDYLDIELVVSRYEEVFN